MSTLTKVLIILQIVFSCLLCGITVNYVATANNFKKMYDKEKTNASRERNDRQEIEGKWELAKSEFDEKLKQNTEKLANLETANTELISQIKQLQRDLVVAKESTSQFATAAESNSNTAGKLEQSLAQANAELVQLRSDQLRLERELTETNDILMEKMAVINTQADTIKRLREEGSDYQAKLQQAVMQYGKLPEAKPVTQIPDPAQSIVEPMQDLAINGQVTQVDSPSALAEINIGSTDGVKKGMVFLVTRNSSFVCKLVIIETDADRAVGTIQLRNGDPRMGDKVTTNL